MIRVLVLSLLAVSLSASAIFRLHTETVVRAERRDLAQLERERGDVEAELDRLRFEVEVLASAPRLNELTADRLPLAPGSVRQTADGEGLREVLDPIARWEQER
ncbi:MAG: hypothetical protein AAGI89_07305 [Pseudomonadota bacterium]